MSALLVLAVPDQIAGLNTCQQLLPPWSHPLQGIKLTFLTNATGMGANSSGKRL